MVTTEMLSRIPGLMQASQESLTYLAGTAIQRTVKRGETVFHQGEPSEGLYYIEEGRIKIVRYASSGRELIIRFFSSGDTFNEIGALNPGANPASAIAVQRSRLILIPAASFHEAVSREPALYGMMAASIGNKLRFAMERVEELTFLDVRARLIHYLLSAAEQEGAESSAAPLSQDDLAARLGTVRQVLGRALSELQDLGAIRVRRGRIEVMDRPALERLAEEAGEA